MVKGIRRIFQIRLMCLLALLLVTFNALAVNAPFEISISNPPSGVRANSVGDTQFWANAGNLNVGGVLTPISLRATLQSISAGDSVDLFTSGDNPVVRANTSTLAATILWEVFDRNTGLALAGNPDFLITDIDGRNGSPIESVSAACAGLTSFTTNGLFSEGCNANSNNNPPGNNSCESNIRVSESGGSILAEGTQNQNGNQQEGYMQYSWTDVSSWTVSYFATTGGRWYVHDADGDIPFDGSRVDINLVDLATIKGLDPSSLTTPAQGDQVTYRIELSNAGPADATNANLTDLLPAGLVFDSAATTSGNYNPTTGLWSGIDVPVGESRFLTITATITAPAGTAVVNETTTALADESICSSRDSLTFSFVVAEVPAPSLSVVKSLDSATSFSAAGDTITYSYVVQNTGNVNINGVSPVDAGPTFNGQPATNALSSFSPTAVTLTPGQSQTFTATYILDQIDIDNMAMAADPLTAIDNTATAIGAPTAGALAPVTASTVETGFTPSPSLTVVKSVSTDTSFDQAGDVITYDYLVTNTGNITIDSVMPVDGGPTFNGVAGTNALTAFDLVSVSLAPAQNQTFQATYELSLIDVDNMATASNPLTAIENSATATGDPLGNTALPAVVESVATTGFAPTPSLVVDKSVAAATSLTQAGDTITYEFLVQNTGNVTVNNVVPVDSGPTFNGQAADGGPLSGFTPTSASIAPQGSQLFTATYVLSQLDVDNMAGAADPAAAISNSSSAQGNPTGGILPAVTPDTVATGFVPITGLTLNKVAGTPTVSLGSESSSTDAGDTIAYSFEVTNTSAVTLSSLQISDLGVTFNTQAATGTMSAIVCPVTQLNPNQSTTCTAIYTLSQGDVDNAVAGGTNSVSNNATANAETPGGTVITSANAVATTSILAGSSIEIAKSASAPTVNLGFDATIVDPDDTISYSVLVTNAGNTTLTNVAISDDTVALSCPSTTVLGNGFNNNGADSLAVGDSITCTATYVLLQGDLDAGGVTNIATVMATDAAASPLNASDTVISGFTQKAAVALVKTGSSLPTLPDVPVVGDLITYSFELTNTGNVRLSSAQVSDVNCQIPGPTLTRASGYLSGDTLDDSEMDAGEVWLFECQYAITQPDIDAGEIANAATGTGTPPAGAGLAAPTSMASNLSEAQQNTAISLIKTASLPTVVNGDLVSSVDVGDTISYTFDVENTGNVTLTNVVVTDPLVSDAPNSGTVDCPAGLASMAPGDLVTCTATYSLVLDDVNSGQASNAASVTGEPPVTVPPTDAPVSQSSTVVNIAAEPQLDVVKTVDVLPSPFVAGSTITYNYLVTNSGNVTINSVAPVDAGPTFNGIAGTNSLVGFNPAPVSLDPTQSQSFTAVYTVSQTDLDNLSTAANALTGIDNVASATGVPIRGILAAVVSSAAETGLLLEPAIELIKTSTAPALVLAGEQIVYDFSLQNSGAVSIDNPSVSDANCATPGSVLSFATGFISGDTGAEVGVLEPGETWLFSCQYPITQDDIDAGSVQNTAIASGQTPSGVTIQDTSDTANPGDGGVADDDPTNTALTQTPAWTVDKTTTSTPTSAGDVLTYQFVVDNTGNVSISNVSISDGNCSSAITLGSGDTNSDDILDPLEIWTYSCTSVGVSQLEVDAGVVSNTVNVVGMPPVGAPALPAISDTEDTNIPAAPAFTLVKSAAAPTVGFGAQATAIDPDDQIVYSFDVTNTGNVTLSSLSISDPGPTFNGLAAEGSFSSITCLNTSLLPNQATTCSATYTLVQDDIDSAIAGGVDSIANTATAQATPPVGVAIVSDPASAVQSIVSNPELTISKTAGEPTVSGGLDTELTDPLDTIPFTISVINTGNTTLSNVTITDNLAAVTCNGTATPSNNAFVNGTGSLVVGDTVVCQATYSIIQDNINAGFVINSATVNAEDPAGTEVSGVAEATSSFIQKTSLNLVKTSNQLPPVPIADVSTLTYAFNLTNTGNVSLTDVAVTDVNCQVPVGPLTAVNGLTSGDDGNGILDAGETWVLNCDYTITQDDIDLGEVSNVATATGVPPLSSGLDSPSATASNLADAGQTTGLTMDKVSGAPTQANGTNTQEGDTVEYTFTIQNQGNVTLTDIELTDALITGAPNNASLSCVRDSTGSPVFDPAIDALAPTEVIICTGVYSLQQVDIDAGIVTNMAEVTGTPPVTVPPIDQPVAISGSTAPIPSDPMLTIDKTANAIPSAVLAGDLITYSYEIMNTGNVTVNNVFPVDLGPTINGFAGTNALSAYDPPQATLAPGDVQVFEATYELSQLDLDRMGASSTPATAISNEATVDGEPANGVLPLIAPDTVQSGVVPDPELTLTKTSSIPNVVNAGDLVTYTFVLQNTGNVTIADPVINDAMCQLPASPLTFSSGFVSGDTGAIAESLDVNESWTFSCQYALTQADIDNGTVQNTATGEGRDPAGNTQQDVSDSGNAADTGAADDDPTNTPILRTPSWTVDKSTTSTPTSLGDTLDYQFVVTNTGNVSISGVSIVDNKCQATPTLVATSDIGGDGIISPAGAGGAPSAEQWIYTCTSIGIVQSELDAAVVNNNVEVSGTAPGGNPNNATDAIATPITTAPAMSLVKSAGSSSLNTDGTFDQIFNFALQNTGNVTLNSVSITDNIAAQFGVCSDAVVSTGALSLNDSAPTSDSTQPSLGISPILATTATLAVGDTIALNNYIVRFNPNAVGCSFPVLAMNTASAAASTLASGNVNDVSDNGVNPSLAVSNSAGVPTPFVPPAVNSELGIAKAAGVPTLNIDGTIDVEYTLLVENTGNVDIENIVIGDDLVTQFGSAFIASPATTALGGVISAPVVTEVLDAGADDLVLPGAVSAYDGSSATNITDGTGYLGVGDRIQVTFTVRINPIAAGAPASLLNTANVSGVDPSNSTVSDASNTGADPTIGAGGAGAATLVASPPLLPSLTVSKTVSPITTFSQAGETITYQYVIENNGNIIVDSVSPVDAGPTFNGANGVNTLQGFNPASSSINPGDSVTFTATYLLDIADVNNMAAAVNPLVAIVNTASATGDPIGPVALPTVVDSTVMTGFSPTPSLSIDKSISAATSFSEAGDEITYQFLIENTGNVTINNVVPVDDGPSFNAVAGENLLGSFTPPNASLAPNDSQLFTAVYVLSQGDVDEMSSAADSTTAIENSASADGVPTGGVLAPVTADTAAAGFALTSELTLSKTLGAISTSRGANSLATDGDDTIVYNFEVTNNGTVTIDSIQINDQGITFNAIAGSGSMSAISCPQTSLAPDQSTVCVGTYTLSQTDVDNAVAGGVDSIENTATASGQTPASAAVVSTASTALATIAPQSSIELNKSAEAPTVTLGSNTLIVDPGDTITYRVTIENSGNTSLSNVLITDPLIDLVCPAVTTLGNAFTNDQTQGLAVGDSVTCTADYTLLSADLDSGALQNTASVSSADPAADTISSSDTVTSGFAQQAAVSLTKAASPLPAVPAAGDILVYSFELMNIGNVGLSSPQVTDPICETPAGPLTFTNGFVSGDGATVGELDAGETWLFECRYELIQADVDLGEVVNTATATGTPPAGSGLASPTSTASNLADAQQNASVSLLKTGALPTVAAGNVDSITDVDDTIVYTFEVENTGNVTLGNVTVSDPTITNAPNNGVINCPVGLASMAPADVVICSATYTIGLADLNLGQVANTASVTGTPPGALTPPGSQSSSVVQINASPSLSIAKSVLPLPTPFVENSVITYRFEVANTGNVSVSDVAPIDAGPTFNGVQFVNTLSAFDPLTADLDPGESQVFEATYVVSQTDIDNLSTASDPLIGIENSSSVSGTPTRDNLGPITPSSVATGAAVSPELELIKSSTAPAVVVEGAEIIYDFTLQNTGDVSITNPIVTDSQCSTPGTVLSFASGFVSGDTGAVAEVLDAGETWAFRCSYTISQDDINAGVVQNSAVGSGAAPSGATVSDTSDSANPADGANDDDPTNTPLAQSSSWTVDKSTSSVPTNAGDTLIYDFVVDNTGNVSISNIVVTDVNCASSIALVAGDTNANSSLDPLEIWTYRCTSLPVSQPQINAGVVSNTVNVAGSPPLGAPVLAPVQDIENTLIAAAPSLSVVKTAEAPTVGLGVLSASVDVGDEIAYSYAVANTGNVTLSNIAIVDSGPTFDGNVGQGTFSAISCAVTSLLPNQTTTCSAMYTLAQEDIDFAIAGGVNAVSNTATADGLPPTGPVISSASSTVTQTITSSPELNIVKTAGTPTIANGVDVALTDPGDTVPFTIVVTNSGNTVLSNVSVSDDLTTVNCDASATPSNSAFVNGASSLLVGDSVSCEATYPVQQADINTGSVVNTATVTAQDPAGTVVSETDQATSSFTQKTSLSLFKSSTMLPPLPVAGVSSLTYTFSLQNTGNVSLTDVAVVDGQCLTPSSPLTFANGFQSGDNGNGVLDASETWMFTCDYTVSQADINLGEVSNVATASGTPPATSGLSAPSSTSSTLATAQQTTGISLDKVGGMPSQLNGSNSQVDDTIDFTFTIQNMGNVTLTDLTLNDPLITDAPNNGVISCVRDDVASTPFVPATDALDPNQVVICSAQYRLMQADIDSGMVGNTAEVSGAPPVSVPPIDRPVAMSGSSVPIVPDPSLSIDKSAPVVPVNVSAGDSITYTYRIENTGNVTISDVTPVDVGPTFNGVSGTNTLSAYDVSPVVLAPTESQVFMATYELSQIDIDNMAASATPTSAISNEATAEGVSINGPAPEVNVDVATTGVAPSPRLELTKSSAVDPIVAAGDTVTYSFMLANVGNVTIANPVIQDANCDAPSTTLSLSSGFISGDVGANAGSLDVNEVWSLSCTYILRQADIDAGAVQNTATASGQDPAGNTVQDVSDSGNANDAGADNDPTITPLLPPSIGVAKALRAGSPVSLGNGTYQITYDFIIENNGAFDLTNVQLNDDLVAMINTPNVNNGSFSNPVVSSPNATLTPNPSYDGEANIAMLSGADSLLVDEVGLLELTFVFTPDVYFGPFFNQAEASATFLGGATLSDLSESGTMINLDAQSPTQFSLSTPSTPITLGWFEAQAEAGGIRFDWATEVEVSNAGFLLKYEDASGAWRNIGSDMIVGKGDSVDVQEYTYYSSDLSSATQFKLVDVSVTGAYVEHGPFALGRSYGLKTQRKKTDWSEYEEESRAKERLRQERIRERLKRRLDELRTQPTSQSKQSVPYKKSGFLSGLAGTLLGLIVPAAHAADLASFSVDNPGLYKVTHSDLLSQGIDLRGVSVERLGLKQANEQWPLMILPAGVQSFTEASEIVFPGQGIDSLYALENKYTLVIDEGTPSAIQPDSRPIPFSTAPATSYLDEARYGPQNIYSHLSPSLTDSWYAERLQAISGEASTEVTLNAEDYVPAVNGLSFGSGALAIMPRLRPRLEVNLWGNSDLPGNGVEEPDHHVLVDLNGQRVSDETFDGLSEFPVSAVVASLNAGANQVKVTLPRDHGYPFDLINLDRVSLFYPRRLEAKEGGTSLAFEAAWNFFKVSGLAANEATVIRLDQNNQGHLMTTRGQGACDQGCVYFPGGDTEQEETYFVATDDGFQTPNIELLDEFAEIHESPAEYLIIAHPDFINTNGQSLERYAQSLSETYDSVDIVSVLDIYNQYSSNVVDAYAIDTYIENAYSERGTRHLMLVGGDIYDYHNNLETDARSFVPSIYVKIARNVNAVPSDAMYADVDGDLIPDITVARLPVRSTQELETVLGKRDDFLATNRTQSAVFAADEIDGSGYSFRANTQDIIDSHFSDWDVATVFLDDVGLSAGRSDLLTLINQGAPLVSYFGHSSTDRWSISGLLTGDDVSNITNYNTPSVMAQWGCWNTFYVSPDQDSLAHQLLVDGAQGAVTVMGATSFTKADAEQRMAQLLFERISNGENIGDAVLSAKRALAEDYPYQLDVLLGWAVLGPDDMLVIQESADGLQ